MAIAKGFDIDLSDDDESEMDVEDFSADLDEIAELEKKLRESPFEYDTHVALVKLRVKVGNIGKMRESYNRMSETFPLTKELWSLWIMREMAECEDSADVAFISNLYSRANEDYLSVDLLVESCSFHVAMKEQLDAEDVNQKIRDVFEEALMTGGLHLTMGNQIWDRYRNFEETLLESIVDCQAEISGDSEEYATLAKEIASQKQRITSVYRRELSVPLTGLEECADEYKEWSQSQMPDAFRNAMLKSISDRCLCQPHEDALESATSPRYQQYLDYIKFETERGFPARIQCIYERALAENCLQPELWIKYGLWLDTRLKDSKTCLAVYHRAVRNCPWSVSLWSARLMAMERHSKFEEIDPAFRLALQAGFGSGTDYLILWKAYCDVKRRAIAPEAAAASDGAPEDALAAFRSTVQEGVDYMEQWFGSDGDPLCFLLRFWADVEAAVLGNVAKAEDVWREKILVKGRGNSSELWLDFARLARTYLGAEEERKILYQAVQCASDNCAVVCKALLDFEAIRGTLAQLDAAHVRCQAQLDRVEGRKAQADAKVAKVVQADEEQQGQRKAARADKRQQKKGDRLQLLRHKPKPKPDTPIRLPQKRKAEMLTNEDGSAGRATQILPPRKKSLLPGSKSEDGFQVPLLPSTYAEEDRMSPKPAPCASTDTGSPELNRYPEGGITGTLMDMAHASTFTPASTSASTSAEPTNGAQDDSKPKFEYNPENKKQTIFVSNLAYTVNDESLREVFGKLGEITDIRIVRKRQDGKKNCYAYIEFSNEEPVEAALKLDRETMEGRPMFVSLCVDKDDGARIAFRYTRDLDTKTLYVTQLPYDMTKEEVAELFGKHGKVADVRLVTNRLGAARGFGYVEMGEPAQASACILHLDQYVVKGRRLGVALSHPPKRKPFGGTGGESEVALGGGGGNGNRFAPPKSYATDGSIVPHSRGRSRTQISLLPRSVRSAPAGATTDVVKAKSANGDKKETTDVSSKNGSQEVAAATGADKPMSNNDFRSMLLQKKN